MQITPTGLNYNVSKANSTSFGNLKMKDVTNDLFTPKNLKLLRNTRNLIDETWTAIRKGKVKQTQPEFKATTKRGTEITLKPQYYCTQNKIVLSVKKGDITEHVSIPKDYLNNIEYEKIRKTEHGSATFLQYSSARGRKVEYDEIANELLEKYLPKCLPIDKQIHTINPKKFDEIII